MTKDKDLSTPAKQEQEDAVVQEERTKDSGDTAAESNTPVQKQEEHSLPQQEQAHETQSHQAPPDTQSAPSSAGVEPLEGHSLQESEAKDAEVEQEAPRPISFLGRRGTAPIRTSEDPQPKAQENPSNDEGPSTPQSPSTPAQNQPLKPGTAENAFRLMSLLSILFLILILGMQTATGIWFPSVFLPSEVAVAEVYAKMNSGGHWLTAPSTTALPAALPGYFWFMRLVDMLPVAKGFFLPLVAAFTALTALLGVYTLGMCANLGNRVSFAAGLILLSSLAFVPLTHVVGPDMLFMGLLCFSLALLYRGWIGEAAYGSLGLGFLLAGLAFLVGGITALWIPLFASLCFILWRGTLRRAHKLDAVIGFGLMLLVVAAWLGTVILLGGENAKVLGPLSLLVLAPFMPPFWPPKDPWWFGLLLPLLGLLPFILVPLFVSWGRVLVTSLETLKASRKENSGAAWIWIALTVGFALMLLSSAKPCLMALPLLPLLALLLAKALLNLSPTGSRLFYLLLSLICLVFGVTLTVVSIPAAAPFWTPYIPANVSAVIVGLQGLPIMAAICLLASVALLKFTNRAWPGGALVVFTLFVIMVVQPATLMTAPSLLGKVAVQHPLGMGIGTLPGLPMVKPVPTQEPVKEAAPPAPASEAEPEVKDVQPVAPIQEAAPAATEKPAEPAAKPLAAPEPVAIEKPAEAAPAQSGAEAAPEPKTAPEAVSAPAAEKNAGDAAPQEKP